MFDVSFSELMVIGIIALIVIGPERLPKVARTVGHLLGRAQRYVNDVKSDIQREIELDELRKFKSEMEDTAQTLHGSLRETGQSLMEPIAGLRDELGRHASDAKQAVSEVKTEVQNTLPGIAPVEDVSLAGEAAVMMPLPTHPDIAHHDVVAPQASPAAAPPADHSGEPPNPLEPSATLPLPPVPPVTATPAPPLSDPAHPPQSPTGTPS